MTHSTTTDNEKGLIALALLLAARKRPDGAPGELEELDLWRKGRLDKDRAAEIQRKLLGDPQLMRQLEELEMADRVLARLEPALAQTGDLGLAEQRRGWLRSLSGWLDAIAGSGWMRPVAIMAACLALVAVILPLSGPPDFDQQLEGYYLKEGKPIPLADWPWRAAGQTKGLDFWPDAGRAPLSPPQTAFRYGVRQGLEKAGLSGTDGQASLQRLPRHLPECGPQDGACREQVRLARDTGYWAVAAFGQCLASGSAEDGVFTLTEGLRDRWLRLNPEGPVPQVRELAEGLGGCEQVTSLLDWGLR
ncbi:MAG: hypothetical protein KJ558_09430 [Gammaproteobacteria bacterium]|nr:hypothetical protein [Gammaproteobacteria bacterium]MBU1655027.1 hypothetical protein [Gammaproteobacteria bacterium]MBU1961524.1 hypothetical protein [Gammaproteobacteria bacterium]